MSIKGSPYSWFRRSIDAGRALDAWAAAHELEALSLADALALCLVLIDEDPRRYDRAAVRWVGRVASDPRGVDLAGLVVGTSSLAGLPGASRDPAVAALDVLLEQRGDEAAREALAAWAARGRR